MRECVFPEKRAWERSRKRGKLELSSTRGAVRSDHATARSTDEDSHGEQLAAGVSPDGVKRQPPQGQQPAQYHATSPFQQGWSLSGNQASPQNGHSSQSVISPEAEAEGSARSQTSPGHVYQGRHRSNSSLASSMMRTVVASGNDALNILFEAATAQNQDDTPATDASPPMDGGSRSGHSNAKERATPGIHASPATFESVPRAIPPTDISDATQETLTVWDACRFVKMGWFTAREAVTFVDL